MIDQKKSVLTELPALRRDWGDGVPEELSTVLTQALQEGERVMILYVKPGPDGTTISNTAVFSRHTPQTSWLEFLAVIQMKCTEWFSQLGR